MTYICKRSELSMWGNPPPNREKPHNMEKKLEKKVNSPFVMETQKRMR